MKFKVFFDFKHEKLLYTTYYTFEVVDILFALYSAKLQLTLAFTGQPSGPHDRGADPEQLRQVQNRIKVDQQQNGQQRECCYRSLLRSQGQPTQSTFCHFQPSKSH